MHLNVYRNLDSGWNSVEFSCPDYCCDISGVSEGLLDCLLQMFRTCESPDQMVTFLEAIELDLVASN